MEIFGGGGSKKRASHAQVQAIQQGGKKADLIRKAANEHHSSIDIPDAELFLETALRQDTSNISPEIPEKKPIALSFWQQAKDFWNRLFL